MKNMKTLCSPIIPERGKCPGVVRLTSVVLLVLALFAVWAAVSLVVLGDSLVPTLTALALFVAGGIVAALAQGLRAMHRWAAIVYSLVTVALLLLAVNLFAVGPDTSGAVYILFGAVVPFLVTLVLWVEWRKFK